MSDYIRLLQRHFPRDAWRLMAEATDAPAQPPERLDEFDDLVTLLLEKRADESDETRWLAHALATACMGDNHLWQDMGLPHRAALSELMLTRFPALAAKNSGDMRWKKFLYKQLCERAEVFICKAPSCAVCVDYDNCFGPEDG